MQQTMFVVTLYDELFLSWRHCTTARTSVSRGFVASNRSSTVVNTRWQTEDLPLNFIHYLLLLQLLLLGLLPDWHWTVSTVHNHGDKTGGVLNDRYHHRFTTCLMHWLWNGQTNDSLVEIKNYFYLLAAVPYPPTEWQTLTSCSTKCLVTVYRNYPKEQRKRKY